MLAVGCFFDEGAKSARVVGRAHMPTNKAKMQTAVRERRRASRHDGEKTKDGDRVLLLTRRIIAPSFARTTFFCFLLWRTAEKAAGATELAIAATGVALPAAKQAPSDATVPVLGRRTHARFLSVCVVDVVLWASAILRLNKSLSPEYTCTACERGGIGKRACVQCVGMPSPARRNLP